MPRLKRNLIIFLVLTLLFAVSVCIDHQLNPRSQPHSPGLSPPTRQNLMGVNKENLYKEFYGSMEESIEGKKVKVAAIQCSSPMGQLADNRQTLTQLITRAATRGAKIVVTPECAVSGYMNPLKPLTWTKNKPTSTELPVQLVAESIPGPSTQYFGKIAKKEKIYLCISLVESADKVYYNTQIIFDPEGKMVGLYRKQNLCALGDFSWACPDDAKPQITSTPYGKLGMMIGYDVHTMPDKLKALHADIVLYSVAWWGGNGKKWFRHTFPEKYVKPNHFAVISSNWSAPDGEKPWEGSGYSTVYSVGGKVVSSAKSTGDAIVYAELPVRK